MGITIGDTITLSSGIEISNTYASFSSSDGMPRSVSCYKTTSGGNTVFQTNGTAFIYKDQSAKEAGKSFLDSVNVSKNLTVSELGTISAPSNKNLYGYLYDQLKSNYSSTTDVE